MTCGKLCACCDLTSKSGYDNLSDADDAIIV